MRAFLVLRSADDFFQRVMSQPARAVAATGARDVMRMLRKVDRNWFIFNLLVFLAGEGDLNEKSRFTFVR